MLGVSVGLRRADVLCGEGGVVHEEKVNIGDCILLVPWPPVSYVCIACVPLATRKALWPEGIRWRVLRLDP
jgi:hypothetical protein